MTLARLLALPGALLAWVCRMSPVVQEAHQASLEFRLQLARASLDAEMETHRAAREALQARIHQLETLVFTAQINSRV